MVSETRSTLVTPILTGPTAVGKTAVAVSLARRQGKTEIINADSLLVYREMSIGTAKPSDLEQNGVPHHLINIRNPDEPFTAGDFVRETHAILEQIHARGHRALIVGGTPFYLKALRFGLWDVPPADPEIRGRLEPLDSMELYTQLVERDEVAALRIGRNDRYRMIRALEIIMKTGKTPTQWESEQRREPDPNFPLWIVERDADELKSRAALRVQAMIKTGLIEEVEKIASRYPDSRALKAVGYAETLRFLRGERPLGRNPRPELEGLTDEILLSTLQLIKRQRTWFKSQSKTPGVSLFILDQDLAALEQAYDQV